MTEHYRDFDDCANAKASASERFMPTGVNRQGLTITEPFRNVVGIGIGPKLKGPDRKEVAPHAVRFFVESKIGKKDKIPPGHFLPAQIENLPTDVIETGRLRAGGSRGLLQENHLIKPGTSCGVRFGRCGDGVTGTV